MSARLITEIFVLLLFAFVIIYLWAEVKDLRERLDGIEDEQLRQFDLESVGRTGKLVR